MTTLEPRRNDTSSQPWHAEPALPQLRLAADRTWREDVALEIWVDVTSDAVVVRLEGVLDASTGTSLTDVVRGCQAEGKWDFVLDTGALRIDRGGWALLTRLRQQILAAGGRLRWDSTVLA